MNWQFLLNKNKNIESKIKQMAQVGRSFKILLIIGIQRLDAKILNGQLCSNAISRIVLRLRKEGNLI